MTPATASLPPLLTVHGVSVRFGGLLALSDISFDVTEGEVFTLIGPNGAGKTTLFNVISRIYSPSSGHMDYRTANGVVRITDRPPHTIAGLGIARTFQNIELFEHSTVLQNLLIGRHVHRRTGLFGQCLFSPATRRDEIRTREKVEDVIDFLDLQHYRNAVVGSLPYGVRKLIELARALCMEPRLLLLDEPSSGLNPEEKDDMAFHIQDIRKDLGITVLMVEHDMTLVSKVSTRVLALSQGQKLALGSPAEVQSTPAVIEAYLGTTEDLSYLHRRPAGEA